MSGDASLTGKSELPIGQGQRGASSGSSRESAERLGLFVQEMPAAVAMFDREMRYVAASGRWVEDFGLAGRNLIGYSHYEVFPEVPERWKEVHRPALSGETVKAERDRFPRADGSVQWLRWEVRPWTNAIGEVGGLLIFSEDISALEKVYEELRKLEMLQHEAGELAHVGGWEFDPATLEGTWTEETARIHDMDPAAPIDAARGLAFFEGESLRKIESAVREAIERGTPYSLELELVSATGRRKIVRTICNPIVQDGKVVRLRGSMQDITEKRRAERALLMAETRYRVMFENAAEGIMAMDTESSRLVFFNRAICEMFGYGEEEFGRLQFEDLHPKEAHAMIRRDLEALDRGRPPALRMLPCVRKDGSIFEADIRGGVAVIDGAKTYFGFFTDATERARAAKYVAASPAVLYALRVTRQGNRAVWFSENAAALTGLSSAEIAQNPQRLWDEGPHPEDAERVAVANREALERGRASTEFRFRRRDGTWIWLRDEKSVLRDGDGRPVEIVGSWLDVTGRIRLEEQFRQAQRMEAVGRLAGGIAHDFNNLLTVIMGYGEMLLSGRAENEHDHEAVSEIVAAGARAAALTRQLLAFSRKQLLEPKVLDLNEVVTGTDKMLHRLIGEDVDLVTVPGQGLWNVRADPGQIEQILMNLAVNARDAMPKGGKLTIETHNVELDEAYAREHVDVRPGPHAMLAVSDTGTGMDEVTLAKIFEPFFTTKEKGKGTGLGLSTVHGIVEQSGGHIWVYSVPGRGTTFKIYFPRCADRLEPVREVTPSGTPVVRASETVLLVEDDVAVRRLAQDVLADAGYEVLAPADAGDASTLAQQHAGPIHLILTDVVMPGVSGPELVARIRALRPGAKVLYMSGYSDEAVAHHGFIESGASFLGKPFTIAALLDKVREVLSQ